MLTHIALVALTISGPTPSPAHTAMRPYGLYRPRVEVWTAKGDNPSFRGDGARVYLRADQDAYVTLFRVDTDGRVRVLFPRAPWEDNFVRGGKEFEVQTYSSSYAFTVDDYPGVGYVFAVAAADPFVYDAIETSDHWDYRVIADGRVRGDPYVALTDLAQRIVPDGYTDWDYDLVPYYVRQHYDYPRFLCYDCHTYVSYPYWSPYDYTCIRFRIVVFDDPYYYPYRYYGGTRVVFTRPLRPEPRFIFKDRQASDAFITRVRARPVDDNQRREVGVRSRDRDGTGVVPQPPVLPRPRSITGDQSDGERDRDRPRERARTPDAPTQPEQRPRPAQPEGRDRPDRPLPPARRPEPPVAAPPPPRAEPRREAPPPKSEPRVEPKRDAPKEKPRAEPELKRRKP